MGQAVIEQGMEPRIAKEDHQARPGRRVTQHKGGQILLNPLEKHLSIYIFRNIPMDSVLGDLVSPEQVRENRPSIICHTYKMPDNSDQVI
jgi:hypothetical protein